MMNFEVFSRNGMQNFWAEGCIVPSPGEHYFWLGWGGSQSSECASFGKLSVYVPDFFLRDKKPWRIFPHSKKLSGLELQQWMAQSSTQPGLNFSWENPELGTFEKMFSDLQDRLHAGEMKKAVPVVFARASGKMGSEETARILSRALEIATGFPLNVYGFWNSREGRVGLEGMIGATPELLFHQKDAMKISTVALAGTRPHDSGVERMALLEDPKELEEHRFVLDGISAALRGWGGIRFGKTRELRLQKFSHLLTPVEVDLSTPREFAEIVRALHPTPALGAWPREAGLKWLESLQKFGDRRRFGAPFGAITESGEGICWVAIRGLQWVEDQLLLGAGCGVTEKSELQREWNELGLKLESSRMVLGL